MSLAPGTRIGSYEVLNLIGTGGMGEVYRGRDARLKRDVAIKVLPALVADDAERLARFEREAQTLAALNHPHIAAIYGFESAGPGHALVMELIEGPTLADRVAGGPLPLREALGYARQIADAVEAAHEKGIIHRDLKPANIKLTADGAVKVLDFGLAKALDPPGPGNSVSNSPTLTARATQLGMILGTAAYMAPEQARGKVVDRRADVWAFGCVLYELITGRRAFEGEEITDVLARLIERDPDWAALPRDTPPPLRRLLTRCLVKDPKARLRDIGEARIAIDEMLGGMEAASIPAAPMPPMALRSPASPMLPWIVAAVMAALAVTAFLWPRRDGAAPSATNTRLTRVDLSLAADVEFFANPNLSSDGQRVAFVGVREGVRQVFVRELNQAETRALAGTDGANLISFSPDGQAVAALMTDGRIKRVTLQTGVIDELAQGGDLLGGVHWGRDDGVYFGAITKLLRVPSAGGAIREVVTADASAGETAVLWPFLTPDGRTLLFTAWRTVQGSLRPRVDAVAVAGGRRHTVIEGAEYVMAVTADRILFQRDAAMFVAPFDPASATLTGAPTKVSEEIHANPTGSPALSLGGGGALLFAASRVFNGRLVWVSMEGFERAVNGPARAYSNPRVSPDGTTVAFSELGAIWTIDVQRGALTKVFTGLNGLTGYPVWSHDGTELIFRTADGIYVQRADGEGQPRLVKGSSRLDYPSSVTPDGKMLAMLRISPEFGGDLLVHPLGGGEARTVVATKAYEGGPQVSPDGKWIAYISNESSRMQVYLRPLDGPDRKWPVSTDGGLQTLWSRDGKRIFYRTGQQMRVVDVQTSPDVKLSAPRVLFERRYAFGPNLTIPNYSISRDGKELLLVREESGSGHLSLVFNWLQNAGR